MLHSWDKSIYAHVRIHPIKVLISAMAFQIASLAVYSTVYSGRWNEISKLRVSGLCEGNSPITGDAENVSIWWRHHATAAWEEHKRCQAGREHSSLNCLVIKLIKASKISPLILVLQRKLCTVKSICNKSLLTLLIYKSDLFINIVIKQNYISPIDGWCNLNRFIRPQCVCVCACQKGCYTNTLRVFP